MSSVQNWHGKTVDHRSTSQFFLCSEILFCWLPPAACPLRKSWLETHLYILLCNLNIVALLTDSVSWLPWYRGQWRLLRHETAQGKVQSFSVVRPDHRGNAFVHPVFPAVSAIVSEQVSNLLLWHAQVYVTMGPQLSGRSSFASFSIWVWTQSLSGLNVSFMRSTI